MEYYRLLNEFISKSLGNHHSAKVILDSLDLQEYANSLEKNDGEASKLILKATQRLLGSGADFVVICSNTGHLSYPLLKASIANVPLLHIADCVAFEIKRLGLSKVGLLGTKYTMENEDIVLKRIREHRIEVVIPPDVGLRQRMLQIILHELSNNILTDESRAFFKDAILALRQQQHVQGVILGCTEIPLLIEQRHVPDVPLLDTTRIHARMAADVMLGLHSIEELLPKKSKL